MAESAFSLFGPSSSRCPFGDNTQASAKTSQPELPPQFGAITQSSIPLSFKPRQVRFERGLPDPKDVGPLTTNDTADQLSAMPGSAHDFLNGQTLTDVSADDGICLFAPQISLVLQPLSGSQQFRVYGCSPDCHPDLPHRFTNGVEKGVTGVLHQMPTVGDLIGAWQGSCDGLRISTTTVSCDDLDLGLLDQPGLGGRLFPVRQQCDCPPAFKIANDGAVSMIASPGPIINADDVRWYRRRAIIPANGSQQRIIAHRESEAICKSGRRATAQCESEMANQTVQARCPASHGANYIVAETLGENLSAAMAGTTDEASHGQVQFEPPTRTRQIGKHPRIAAMNTPRYGSTVGASALF